MLRGVPTPTRSEQWAAIAALPQQLAAADEQQVLLTAASTLAGLLRLDYVRVALVSGRQQLELVELAADPAMPAALAELASSNSSSSTGEAGSSAAAAAQAPSSSQSTAMACSRTLFTPQLQANTHGYADWALLAAQFGLRSFAAVPLQLAGSVQGVILAASAQPHCLDASSVQLVEAVGHMLAPYAAVMHKYSHIQAARKLLHQLLPPRVVAAVIERLRAGGTSAAELFLPAHFDTAG